jgi:KH domain
MHVFVLKHVPEFDEEPQQQNKRRRTFTELNISKEKVGHLIGRSGINIKEIQEKTATRITFKDEGIICTLDFYLILQHIILFKTSSKDLNVSHIMTHVFRPSKYCLR